MSAFDEEFDFVVVGSGAGSMCAAMVMRKAGKSVVVLEKTPLIGGTTSRSGGAMWVPNNRLMQRAGLEDSVEKAMLYLEQLIPDDPATPGASRERRLKYLTESPRMIDFIMDQGIRLARTDDWPDYYDNLPGGMVDSRAVFSEPFNARLLGDRARDLRPGFLPMPMNIAPMFLPQFMQKWFPRGLVVMLGGVTLGEMMKLPHYKRSWAGRRMMVKVALLWLWGKLTGRHYVSAGAGIQGQMFLAALKAGADVRTNASVVELIEEKGRIAGAVVEKDGKRQRIGGRLGVLINAGGFSHNQEMRDRYIPGSRAEWTSATEGDTGEMILEMMRHGAAVAQMEERVGNQTTPMPGFEKMVIKPSMQQVTAKPHAILVDQTGVRFQSEGGSYSAYSKGILERNKVAPAIPSWAIFDERLLTDYMFAGAIPGLAKTIPWLEAGYLRKAGTIEELAQQLDMDPAALRATVDRFNGFVDKGVDEDFHRGESAYDAWLGDPYRKVSASLGRIDQAPFYAVQVLPGDMTTYGGVVTDVDGRVLREDGSVIPGLYATGISTASVMGGAYPGGGGSVGPSMTWGYLSARHAANLGNQLV